MMLRKHRKRFEKNRTATNYLMKGVESLERREVLASDWQNIDFPNDVDGNGLVSPLDAILVINHLDEANRSHSYELAVKRPDVSAPRVDVTGDGFVSPLDAIHVVNVLPDATRETERVVRTSAAFLDAPFSEMGEVTDASLLSEVQVNTETEGLQTQPSIAVSGSGAVVTWTSRSADGMWDVYAQRFTSEGSRIGAPFRVNSNLPSTQALSSVTMNSAGEFVIVWHSWNQDNSGWGIYGQQFSPSGAKVGGEFRVNEITRGSQYRPQVQYLVDGGFVVVWHGRGTGDLSGVYGRVFNTDGTARTNDVRINEFTSNAQLRARVDSLTGGGFVVVWDGRGTGDRYGIWARTYSDIAVPQSPQFQINDSSPGIQRAADVAAGSSNSFFALWEDSSDATGWGVRGRQVEANGSELGNAHWVPGATWGNQRAPVVTNLSNDRYVTAWRGPGTADTSGVFARIIQSDGQLEANESHVNDTTQGFQGNPEIASWNDRYAVTWQGRGDGDRYGVFVSFYAEQIPTFAPIIAEIPDQLTFIDTSLAPIAINVTDPDTPLSELVYEAIATTEQGSPIDATLAFDTSIPRRLTVTPPVGFSGTFRVTVEARDGQNTDSETFNVVVQETPPNSVLLVERDRFLTEQSVAVELGQTEGTRAVSFRVIAGFDDSDESSAFEDTLAVYLLDPADTTQTLLDRGTQGTSLFTLSGGRADYLPGLVRFDGDVVTIDVTSLGNETSGRLLFQLLNSDSDNGSAIQISEIQSVTDVSALRKPIFEDTITVVSPGDAQSLTTFTAAPDINVAVRNIRFNSSTGTYSAALSLMNEGPSVGRQVALVFSTPPTGITLENASGIDGTNRPYVNFTNAIPSGGLLSGTESDQILVEFANPNVLRFAMSATVLAAGPNVAPVLPTIAPLTVRPGDIVRVQLPQQDANGDRVTYAIESSQPLPTGKLNGVLEFSPTPEEVGSYSFTLIASDGALKTRQSISLVVTSDPLTTTRITGRVLDANVDQTPLSGVTVEIGSVRSLTGADGSFTLDLGTGSLASDTIKIRGEIYPGPLVYPFIAEKLPLVLDHGVFPGVNNVITRPIYLPQLDIANGKRIDPMADTLVTTAAIEGASVMVRAGTLMNQQSTPFDGVLSITSVPPSLTPAALPKNLRPDLVLTIQPGEMVFTTPAPLTFPNTAGYDIGTILDLWSINPVTGQFDDVGDMQVVADASAPGGSIIETISGGIRNSSWHFPTPPDPEPKPDDDGDEDNDCDECKDTNGNFEVESHSGAVLDDHAFVSYQSMGQTQGFALHYDSQRADPRPIVHIGYSNLLPRDNQRLVASLSFFKDEFEFQMPGYEGNAYGGLQGGEHFWKLDVTGSGRVALQADFTELESGLYTYELTSGPLQFNGEDFAGTLTTQTKDLKVVNTIDSPFGAGWGLTGLSEIIENGDGSILLIEGGGSELYFGKAPADGQPLVSPPGNFSRLVKLSDGTYEQTMTDKSVYRYNTANHIASMTDRTGNVWRYEYDTNRIITKITDPTGLEMRFTSTNGRITTIIDPAGRVTRLDYDADGNLIKITDPDISSKSWNYDASHRIITETDKRGFTEHMFYDFAGRAIKSVRSDGSELHYNPVQSQVLRPSVQTTDPVNPPAVSTILEIKSQFVDSNGNILETRLDKQGQAVSQIDTEGALNSVGRNSTNLITRSNDGRGNVTSFGHDSRGNITSVRDTVTQFGTTGVGSQGTDFWLAFLQNESPSAVKTLFLSSQVRTSGTVSIVSLDFTTDFTVDPGTVTSVVLPPNVAVSSSDSVSPVAIHVTSDLPISVSGLNQQRFTTDGFLGLPSNVVGREYLVVSSSNGRNNGSHFAVVGVTDDTEVTIVPSATTGSRSAGTPYTLTLNQGQVYYLQNSTRNLDLTGTSISANKPVAVFSGHKCGNVPSNQEACDHMVEQLTPVETWGTAFVTAPLSTRRNGDTFRILASTDDTDITINGDVVATLNRGQFQETILTTSSAIVGTKPILVVQYSNGSGFDGVIGDPFMQLIPPVEQYDNTYTVATPSQGFTNHFINFTIPTVGTGNVTLDGQNIAESQFTEIPGTAFSTSQISVEVGTHTLSSVIPFGMYLYGFGDFDSYGFLGGQRFSQGSQRSYAYDEVFNQLVLFTDDLGHTTSYEIDPENGNTTFQRRVVGNVDAEDNGETDDLVTRYTYTAFNLIDTMTDPLGRATDYDYDSRGRMTSVTHAKGTVDEAILHYEYDLAGNQTALIDGNGNRTEYQYDAVNRMIKSIAADPDGAGPLSSTITTFVYDSHGNLASTTDANNQTSTNRYDNRNRLVESVAPDPDGTGLLVAPVTQYDYDSVGNIDSISDPNGNTTHYQYDGRNRRIEMIDPDGGVTRFGYDTDDNLSLVTDPVGNVTQFRYDARGRLIEEVDPLGHSILYGYDAADNLIQKTDRNGRVTKYTYDDVNRLLKEEWIGETEDVVNTMDYRYDAAGNLLSVADAFSGLAYTYDARNRIKTVDNAGTPGAPNVVLTYGHDDNSNVLTVADAIEGAAGATTSYQYDALDRLVVLGQSGNEVSDKRVNFTYNALGQYSAVDRYRDLAATQLVIGTDYSYDGQNRLTRIDHQNSGGTSVAFYDYEYDVASRITKITDVDGVTNYVYDDRDQLITADKVDAALADEFYQYDANGNRVASSLHGTGYETGPGNRLLSDGTYDYSYDHEGNMIRRTRITGTEPDGSTVREFNWDHRNRLTDVKNLGSFENLISQVEFSYDFMGRKIAEFYQDAEQLSELHTVFDRENPLFYFSEDTNERYLFGPSVDLLLAWETSTTEWILPDHQMTTRHLASSVGSIIKTVQYDVYGRITASLDFSALPRFLFTGREYVSFVELVQLRSRWYSPDIGRFMSEDTIRFGSGYTNTYQYVRNAPNRFTDPFGTDVWVEGPSANEPPGHWSLAVGDPNGAYSAYSFGVNGNLNFTNALEGEVYLDNDRGGNIDPNRYYTTTVEEDRRIQEALNKALGTSAPYTPNSTCRDFVDQVFDPFESGKIGRPGIPPRPNNPSLPPSYWDGLPWWYPVFGGAGAGSISGGSTTAGTGTGAGAASSAGTSTGGGTMTSSGK